MLNKISLSFLLLLTFCFVSNVKAQKNWNELVKVQYSDQDSKLYKRKSIPKNYKLVSLDLNALDNSYAAKGNANQIIKLPNADGKLNRFLLKETSNFQKELQEKFPEIKSFTAQGIDDPTAIAKISIGADGFHGVVFSGNSSTVYIDPFTKDQKSYMVYERSSLPKEDEDFKCLVEDGAKQEIETGTFNRTVDDGKLRTYRIAIVCSGEYAQFHLTRQGVASTETDAVKKAAVLSAMNTSMTRINGVFERDLSVKMVLVSNNDEVIYLDPDTDGQTTNNIEGITDGNANSMISQVQKICDDVIGNDNYDIGHIFSIGGSGLAGLGVVCTTGQKGRGVTGISSPVNDPYDIDYVAHELGHQFGATHTQNNSCNRTDATAVEPGSGSTIMGYAGICSPNVIGTGPSTGNSDDHFHAVSIAQMWTVVQITGSCATETDTNNNAPTANAGVDYTIPRSTPFRLEGSATDADGTSSLTYNWEQLDNEVATTMPPAATNADGPMFRSLPSKTSPIRYMPDLLAIVDNNVNPVWEVLPSVAREMNFSFFVRDNNAGGGNTARDNKKVTVVNGTPFKVSTPSTAVTWDTGTNQTITWQKGSTDIAPINSQLVNIKLSTDGGLTFPIVLKSNTPNDGSEEIVVPNNASPKSRIMVEAADNIFFNVNPINFTINSTEPTYIMTDSSGTLSACNLQSESVTFTVNFDFVNGFNETVSLSASGFPLSSTTSFNSSTINADGNVTLTISDFNNVTPRDYNVKVDATSSSINQSIDLILKVVNSTITKVTLDSPADGADSISLSEELKWDADSNASSYKVDIASDANFGTIVSTGTVNTNAYVSTNLSGLTTYYWRVKAINSCGEGDFSDTFSFQTVDPTYCTSTFTDEAGGSEHITNVTFNTINNNSSNDTDDGYEDFTSISTNVKRGNSHEISITFDTGGFQDQSFVYIDWNQDFVFDNDTEKYDLGRYSDDQVTATLNISVPNDAKIGTTRMRVFIEYYGTGFDPGAGACDSDHASEWGETEDYSLVVEDATASVNDVAFEGFNLYPNPNNGTFNLNFDIINEGKVQLQLFDIRGRLIQEKIYLKESGKFSKSVNFSKASKGLYLLKIKNEALETNRKIIIH